MDSRRWWIAAFLLLAAAIGGLGLLYYRGELADVRRRVADDLEAISRLKAGQIASWRAERLADVRVHSSALLRDLVLEARARSEARETEGRIRSLLLAIRDAGGYESLILTLPGGRLWLSTATDESALDGPEPALLELIATGGTARIGSFRRGPLCGRIHLDVAAPVMDGDGALAAVLTIRSDPRLYLYPLIQTWPGERSSAETLLVAREGDEVVFLNALRHSDAEPLGIRFPLSSSSPAARAVLGTTGFVEGPDYRGVAVLADVRRVPDSPWFLVAKVDAGEALSERRYRALVALLGTLALVLTAGLAVSLGHKGRVRRAYEVLYRAECARRDAQEEVRATLYSIGDGVIAADTAGNVARMNPVAERLTGWKEAEAAGRPVSDVFQILQEGTRAPAANPVERVLAEGNVVGLANHTLLVRRDGVATPVADCGAPIRAGDGSIRGVVLVFRDQTEERRGEALARLRPALMEYAAAYSLEELLVKTLDEAGNLTGSPIGFFHFVGEDEKTLLLQAWSTRTAKEFCRAEGRGMHYPVDEAGVWVDALRARAPVVHNDYASLPHRRGLPPGHAAVARELVVPVLRRDRIVALLGVGNKPEDYTPGDVLAVSQVAGLVWDIVERKRSEEALRALSSRQGFLLDAIPDIVMEVDLRRVYTWGNPKGVEFFGDDVIGRAASDYFAPDQDTYASVDGLFLGEEDVVRVESLQRRRDGEHRLLAWTCRLLRDSEGRPCGAISSARDITDQRRTELRVDHLHRVLRGIRDVHRAIARAEDGMALALEVCCILVDGERYAGALLVLADPGGKPTSYTEAGLHEHFALIAEVLDRGRLPPCCDCARDGGGIFVVGDREPLCSPCPLRDVCLGHAVMCARIETSGRQWGFLAVLAEIAIGFDAEEQGLFLEMARDLAVAFQALETLRGKHEAESQRATLEEQLRQAQKMEAVGRLAGGVAHDFNNLLTVILNSAEFAQKGLGADDPARADLEQIRDASSRAAALVHQLLAFSRRQVLKPEIIDLNLVLASLEPMLRRLLGEDLDLLVVRSARSELVRVDRSQIEQVIVNLAVNARDAMPSGGRLTIETERVELDAEYVVLHPDLVAGPHVRLAVSDTGRGMDEATKARIFEPFFTTKGPGEGSGLGLSTVFGIVKQSGGEISVYSEPERGTTFKVYLPVAAGTTIEVPPPSVPPASGPQTGTVLVVEDEDALRRVVERMLVRGGFTVLGAASGEEAIRISAGHEEGIDLVLTDVVLPGMGGRELVELIRASRPGLRVIYMSGYTDNAIVHHGVLDPGIEFIGKPFTAPALLARVRAILGSPSSKPPPEE